MMTDEDETACRKTCGLCELNGALWPCAKRSGERVREVEKAEQDRQEARLEQTVRRVLREELARVLVAPKGK